MGGRLCLKGSGGDGAVGIRAESDGRGLWMKKDSGTLTGLKTVDSRKSLLSLPIELT